MQNDCLRTNFQWGKMQGLAVHIPQVISASGKGIEKHKKKQECLTSVDSSPFSARRRFISHPSALPSLLQHRADSELNLRRLTVTINASNAGVGSAGFDGRQENNDQNQIADDPKDFSKQIDKSPNQIPYPLSVAIVLCGCALVFSLVAFMKGNPSSLLGAIAKSGFTAAFSLIFVSEIGDKTFFIAALLAMQYDKLLVLLGSMGALSLMTVLSVVIGRIFHAVPAQFQTTLPLGEYAAVTLLLFFGLKSIKDAWDIPSSTTKTGEKKGNGLDEFAEAEELVKEEAPKRLSNPLEILWKSFTLVFFAEWGDRSMLATIALGAAQSPWGVAGGAIVGHLIATSIAIVGGAFLATYISEKLVGYIGGALFIVFAVATFFGVF